MSDASKDRPTASDTGLTKTLELPSNIFSLRRLLWPLLLSFSVLGVIGYFTFDVGQFTEALSQAAPLFLLAALATLVTRIWFSGWRLSHVSSGRLTVMDGVRAQLAWEFFSNVTPSTIGGGPMAAVYITQDRDLAFGDSYGMVVFTVILDQLWFILTIPLLLAGTFYWAVIPEAAGDVGLWTFVAYFVGLLLWALLFGYLMLLRPVLLEGLARKVFAWKLLQRWRKRALAEVRQLRRRAQILRAQPARFYLKGFLLTAGAWMSRYLLVVFIIWSMYSELDAVLAFLRSVAVLFGSLVLPTPGGAGGLEGLYALFFGPPLVPETLMAPTLLLWRLMGYYVFIVLGIFLSMHHVQKHLRQQHDTDAPDQPTNGSPDASDAEAREASKHSTPDSTASS